MQLSVFFVVLLVAATVDGKVFKPNIVITMLENRAFDHMCGWFNRFNPNIKGLTGHEYNRANPKDPKSTKYYVNTKSPYVAPFDPDHSIGGTTEEIFGSKTADLSHPAPMDGFVAREMHHKDPHSVMEGFSPERVKIASSLVQLGAVFDEFFASVPGPTFPNRLYCHAATSHGLGDDAAKAVTEGIPVRTIWDHLEESGVSWKTYFSDLPDMLLVRDMRDPKNLEHFRDFEEFKRDAKEGKLPSVSWVNPRFYADLGPAQDQHPAHNVLEGERFLKELYETLRAGPQWENTVFIVTYDEHGGFFDSMPTPLHNVPNPDGIKSTTDNFNFTRLGVRIPLYVVSPWINNNTVIHAPSNKQAPSAHSKWDLTSIASTLKHIFDLPKFLTKRDAWAAHFEDLIFESRSSPRTDMPMKLPEVPTTNAHKSEFGAPLTDLQLNMLEVVKATVGYNGSEPIPKTQGLAGRWVRQALRRHMGH